MSSNRSSADRCISPSLCRDTGECYSGCGVGDRTYTPASTDDVRQEYKLGVGSLRVDLSRVPVGKELHVKARVGIGELRVIVSRRASVVVDGRVKAGSISVLGHHDDGRNARVRVTGGGNF